MVNPNHIKENWTNCTSCRKDGRMVHLYGYIDVTKLCFVRYVHVPAGVYYYSASAWVFLHFTLLFPSINHVLYEFQADFTHTDIYTTMDTVDLPITDIITLISHLQTYHNGYIDLPTDEDLEAVCYEVIRTTDKDWIKLQRFLDIPQYVMTDILNQRTIHQQVFRY